MSRLRLPVTCPALILLSFAAGCGGIGLGSGSPPAPEGKLISAEEIERSGAVNAWEALRRSGTHLSMREGSGGAPTRMVHRGHGSIHLSSAPRVYVDGAQVTGFQVLRDIPASTIESIQVLDGLRGTRQFGTGAGNGVIVVKTKSGGHE